GLRGGRGCGGGAQHVFLHHATVTAGSLNLIGREALLGHKPVGGRRVLDIRSAGTCRSRRSGGSRGCRSSRIGSGGASGNRAEATAGRHGGTGAGDDRAEPATGGRGHFDRDLVGFELAEHFVLRDAVTDRLVPGGNGRLGHALAQRGHVDLDLTLICRGGFAVLGCLLAGFRRVLCGFRGGLLVDGGEQRVDADGLTFLCDDFGEYAGGGGGNLDRHLVGFELAEHLVHGHSVAHLLEPGGDGGLGDALAEGGHADLGHAY